MLKRIALLIFLFAGFQANAAVIWDETADGDLFNDSLGIFGIGTNTISGSNSINKHPTVGSLGFDVDFFRFDVAAGTQIVGVTVAITEVERDGFNCCDGFLSSRLYGATTGFVHTEYWDAYNKQFDPSLSTSAIPGGSSAYQYSIIRDSNWSLDLGGKVNWDWTVDIDIARVSPVPVPAAVWLFGTALVGLFGFNKRRKAV
ncbi:VPLPA-CTERM sorting domain-containing protein [Gammaproteobacteria bacterium]|nr:VPLPA-CTERM sorting domain-containing protein [Gammaproteobacteria bacterium]